MKKLRRLYLVGRTRIHIDSVKGLGDYLELEVVLDPSEDISAGEQEAKALMEKLEIDSSSLIEGAYVDLLTGPAK